MVRYALEEDLPWILEQLRHLSDEYRNGLKKPLFGSEKYVMSKLKELCEDHIVLLSYRDSKPTGFIIGWVVQHPFNPDIRVGIHASWFVLPEYRHGRDAARLLDAFVEEAKYMGCDRVTLSLAPQTLIKEKTLSRWGFESTDRNYMKEL